MPISIVFLVVFFKAASALLHPAATDAGYLSSLEKEVLDEINFARTQPAKYAAVLEQMKSYFEGKLFERPGEVTVITEEGVLALEEAVRFLRKAKPQRALAPSRGLSSAARDHVRDQGARGAVGHRSHDGAKIEDRLERYGRWLAAYSENISYGESTARMIVAAWIIDDGVPDRGHRRNLFDDAFKLVGIACGEHAAFNHMCVADFAAGFQERE